MKPKKLDETDVMSPGRLFHSLDMERSYGEGLEVNERNELDSTLDDLSNK